MSSRLLRPSLTWLHRMKASTATEVSGVKGCLIIFPSRPIYVAFVLVIVFESSEYFITQVSKRCNTDILRNYSYLFLTPRKGALRYVTIHVCFTFVLVVITGKDVEPENIIMKVLYRDGMSC